MEKEIFFSLAGNEFPHIVIIKNKMVIKHVTILL